MATDFGHRLGRPAAGFTLIEVLVVVLIVGIVLTFATLSVNPTSPSDRLDTAAKRLNALLGAARDDAILYGREMGLDITPHGYRFMRLGNDGWRAIAGSDSPLRPRKLGPGLALALVSQQKDRPNLAGGGGAHDQDNANDRAAPRPEVYLLSSGELVPFRLALSASGVDHRYKLTGQANGDIGLQRIQGG